MSLVLTEPTHARAGVDLVRAVDELRAALAAPRREGRSIGLVPTMGSLHEGHLALLRAARAECEVVVMSLFVNPTQFGPGEDLDRYPRDERRDLELAAEAGVDVVYAPPVSEVYPEGFATAVEVGGLTEVLCGDPSRRGPGHFRGVTTVVAKLFNTVQPDVAYFGQKDAQQVAAIRRMVRDLDFPRASRGAADRARARRAGDELAQRVPRSRRSRAGDGALPFPARRRARRPGRIAGRRTRSRPARAGGGRRSSPSTSRRAIPTTSPRSPSGTGARC